MDWLQLHVDANNEVTLLVGAAATIRSYAGALKYHPVTGLANPPGEDFAGAVRRLRESIARIQGWVGGFEEEEGTLAARYDPLVVAEVRAGHERVQKLADLLRAAIEVMEGGLAHPERAALDAPYGLGAPRRPHPGAQATWVGERAESLARELAYVTLLKENLAPQVRGSRAPGEAG